MNKPRNRGSSNTEDVYLALVNGSVSMLETYFQRGGMKGLQDSRGRSLLTGSLLSERWDLLDRCLTLGVCPNIPDDLGQTTLHWAAHLGQVDMVEKLIAAGAEVDKQDREGRSPLMVAVINQQVAAAESLIKHRCSLVIKDRHANTVLHHATSHLTDGQLTFLLSLVTTPLSVIKENLHHLSPLTRALERKQFQMAEAVLQYVPPSEPSLIGVMHSLALRGHSAGVSMLLRHGVCPLRHRSVMTVARAIFVTPSLRSCRSVLVQEYAGATYPDGRNLLVLLHVRMPYYLPEHSHEGFLGFVFTYLGIMEHIQPVIESWFFCDPFPTFREALGPPSPLMPLSLKSSCRTSIRLSLSPGITRKAQTLPLPKQLKRYVCLEDEMKRMQSNLV